MSSPCLIVITTATFYLASNLGGKEATLTWQNGCILSHPTIFGPQEYGELSPFLESSTQTSKESGENTRKVDLYHNNFEMFELFLHSPKALMQGKPKAACIIILHFKNVDT